VRSTNRRDVRGAWFHLRNLGLEEDRYGSYVGELSSERAVQKLKRYCERKHLSFHIDNAYGNRGGSYRSIFFRTHPPAFGHYYFCAYCGKLLPAKKVTVDHLYPVGSASRDPHMQKKLWKRFSGINDPDNLVASCEECNRRKGENTGAWIRRGRRGRHAWYWELRWAFRIAFISAGAGLGIYALIRFLT
jgi:5-methylcytosine-specific restriction endonuclease McrA